MRYSRQTAFKKIGNKGQDKIHNAIVTIVGLGGLGSNASNLLARAGVKKLILIDHDKVDNSNLQRQTLYSEKDLGKPKAEVASKILKEISSHLEVEVHDVELTKDNWEILNADIILDCTDNLETRELINKFCLQNKIPWVHASCVRDIGEVFTILPGWPCYECVFGNHKAELLPEKEGILNTTVAMTASIQVNEALKFMLGLEPTRELIRFNIWEPYLTKIKVSKSGDCPDCSDI